MKTTFANKDSNIIIADDSCNGQELEFAEFLRSIGFSSVAVAPATRSSGIDSNEMNALWDEFCRS